MTINMELANNQTLDCSVCHEAKDSPIVAHGNDLHPVHQSCLQAWMNTQGQANSHACPTCRIPITSVNGQPVAQPAAAQPANQPAAPVNPGGLSHHTLYGGFRRGLNVHV